MSTPLKLSTKIIILVSLAIAFGASLVALSVRDRHDDSFVRWDLGGDRDSKKVEKTFTVEPGGKLILDASGANIIITGSGTNEVHAVVKVRCSAARIRRYDVKFVQDGNTVTIDGTQESNFFNFHFFEDSFEAQYEVEVPTTFNVKATTSGGNISISDVKGDVDGETSGGDLDIQKLDGKIRLTTSGGNVTARDVKGDMNLETSGGNIEAEEVVGPMSFETSGGNITIRKADGSVHASTSGGNIEVMVSDNKGMDLETSGGSVKIAMPRNATATVDAETSGGDVECELEYSGKIKDGEMHGKINGGGSSMRLRSTGGSILITSRE